MTYDRLRNKVGQLENKLGTPPKSGSAVNRPDRNLNLTVKIECDDILHKILNLPEYGEVKITCHGGKVTLVETTTKEKVE